MNSFNSNFRFFKYLFRLEGKALVPEKSKNYFFDYKTLKISF